MIISCFSLFFSVNTNDNIFGWVQWQLSDRTRFASLLGLQIPWGDASEAWICRMIWLQTTCKLPNKRHAALKCFHFCSNKSHIFKKIICHMKQGRKTFWVTPTPCFFQTCQGSAILRLLGSSFGGQFLLRSWKNSMNKSKNRRIFSCCSLLF